MNNVGNCSNLYISERFGKEALPGHSILSGGFRDSRG